MGPKLCALGLAGLTGLTPVQAQTFKDAAFESLYQADKADDMLGLAAQRLSVQPADAQAVLGLALGALRRDEAKPRLNAIERAEACVDKQPKAAECHYALGVVLGVQAMSEGLFKAARSAGKVRDALVTAHALDPGWYPARSALVEFYLLAPGMMGGSTSKAVEAARSAPRREEARLLEARVAMADKRYDAAVQALLSLPAALPPELVGDAREWAVQCGLGMVNAGQAAQAQPLLERTLRDHPGQAGPAYGLARVRGEAGSHEEALRLYEQAAQSKGADTWPLAYRIGIEQQALGRKESAKASFTRFIAAGKGQKASLEDAARRLEQLGG
jgi:tetratricopeptide (TPR) repeat protein